MRQTDFPPVLFIPQPRREMPIKLQRAGTSGSTHACGPAVDKVASTWGLRLEYSGPICIAAGEALYRGPATGEFYKVTLDAAALKDWRFRQVRIPNQEPVASGA